MKTLSLILKILMLILTAIWGMGCGILFPAVIIASGGEIVSEELAGDHVMLVWLVTCSAGYVLSAVLVMCGFCKIASALSLLGFGGILYVYARFAELNPNGNAGPTELYMPCIFITILILCITAVENRGKIKDYLDKKAEKKEEIAPSILADSGDIKHNGKER